MAPSLANGNICYLEIPATNVERASHFFYRDGFGWRLRERSAGHTAFGDPTG